MSSDAAGARFRTLVADGPIACAGAYDALSAKVLASLGARALYVSGYAAAASAFGLPDLGLVTQSEMAEHIRRICRATALPVIADADAGYGGLLNVERTVREWEAAGAAGLHLEDQPSPKKCGHIAGKAVVPADEMLRRIDVALAARADAAFLVIARTDAIAVHGIEDAIARCRRYAAAGADALFVDAPASELQMATIADALRDTGKPLVFNAARTGKSPVLSVQHLAELGYDIVLYPIEAMLAAHRAVETAMGAILRGGSTDAAAPMLSTFGEINARVDLAGHVAREAVA